MTEKRNNEVWMAQNRPLGSFCAVGTAVGSTGSILTSVITTAIGKTPDFVRLTHSGTEGWLVRVKNFVPVLPTTSTPQYMFDSLPVTSGIPLIIDMKNVQQLHLRSFASGRNYLTIECW